MVFSLPVVVEKVVVDIGVEQKTTVGDFIITPFVELNENFMEVIFMAEIPGIIVSVSAAEKWKSPSSITNC
jgi:hypothetical protein